ncbi:hypothetical protein [Flavobacterium psychrophilum]|uniref:Uncharacterized protein n=1 Tax=Flavobacterium psychrophilum TaxID=96345 RepID=A0A7U2NED2_FLAPS|nr:hypothetical protein [Flavobacterium psychrophilum]QRE03473.1 hypothetical protein H0H26_11370 [Flavobacterium psychrophilum]
MNIQDELQKIHNQYGTSEKANYEIQKLFDKQIRNCDFMACHFTKQLLAMPNNKLESKTVREHYDEFKKRYLEDNSSN